MSVILFSQEEIIELFHSIISIPDSEYLLTVEKSDVAEVLQSVHLANASAFAITYGEPVKLELIDFDRPAEKLMKPTEVFGKIKSLMYNCISNGGRNFLPDQDSAFLRKITDSIAWKLVEEKGKREVFP